MECPWVLSCAVSRDESKKFESRGLQTFWRKGSFSVLQTLTFRLCPVRVNNAWSLVLGRNYGPIFGVNGKNNASKGQRKKSKGQHLGPGPKFRDPCSRASQILHCAFLDLLEQSTQFLAHHSVSVHPLFKVFANQNNEPIWYDTVYCIILVVVLDPQCRVICVDDTLGDTWEGMTVFFIYIYIYIHTCVCDH